ncbi:hypothetical protein JHK85_024901 [Glycine max]|nr:hypothetical protein JHK85_024901 [Glycine max]
MEEGVGLQCQRAEVNVKERSKQKGVGFTARRKQAESSRVHSKEKASRKQVKPYSKFTVNLIDPLEWLWMVQHNLHVLGLVCIMPFEEIEN